MSEAKGPVNSTPAKNHTSARSQAGNEQYKQANIRNDLELDIKNATKCDLDNILKYFLYLILAQDSSKKKKLDQIQDEIESLQQDRYYKTKNENASQSGENQPEGATETNERQETLDDGAVSEAEQKLVQRREKILDEILEEVLNKLLPVANTKKMRKLLQNFANKFPEVETARYAPYVILCNDLLKTLKSVTTDSQFRDPDPLDIRFHRNDPQIIYSKFDGVTDRLGRKPDVIITSLLAALRAGRIQAEKSGVFSEKPKIDFHWQTILANNEFKVQKRENVPKSVETSTSTISRGPKVEHNDLGSWDLTVADSDASSNAEVSINSKRLRDDNEDTPDSLHVPKKRRGPNSPTPTPTGSNNNSAANSTGTKNSETKPLKTESQTILAVNGRIQCASYAMEVLSYSAGVHHAINLLFTDDYLWIWYYDRQGIVQSNGMSIFSDFPRFLVLLFALQRFNLEDWGIISSLNPKALLAHGLAREKPEEKPTESSSSNQQDTGGQSAKGKAKAKNLTDSSLPVVSSSPVIFPLTESLTHYWHDNDLSLKQVELNMGDFLSTQPHCLAGRATAVVSATGLTSAPENTPMVCKIYHPEVQRRHEGLTLQVIHNIAKERDPDMLNHLPTMYFHGDMPNTTTQRIRSMVGRSWKGHRVLRILGLKKLKKITTVDGSQFVKAWLDVVTCHSFLWKNHIEHGDPSVNNMMYNPDTKCGVLTDFDLSLLQWEPRVLGTDRTGTIPFMAIDLLTSDYWDGQTPRFHYHELESFIWILTYVFLLYEDGVRTSNEFVDPWRTSDYVACRRNKLDFNGPVIVKAEATVKKNFQEFWPLAQDLCLALHLHRADKFARTIGKSNVISPSSASKELWNIFIEKLQSRYAEDDDLSSLVIRLQSHKPDFEEPGDIICRDLRDKFRPILQQKFDTAG